VIEDQGDCWWDGPDAVECDVCWDRPARLDGLSGRFWLLHLRDPMHDQQAMAHFEYVLVLYTGRFKLRGRHRRDFSVPMYPVLRHVQPGESVSFDAELLAGVKATIYRT
jgi:hypothetical protein